jgi:hypothetical protein
LQSAQQLELQTSNIHEHGALFPHATPGEKKIFSALSLSSVTFTLSDYVFIEFVIIGKLLHALPYFGVYSVGSPREACRAVEAVNHITELYLFSTTGSLISVLPLPWFW